MSRKNNKKNREEYFFDNEIGAFLYEVRKMKGYTIEEICGGICSISTLSRIEEGKKVVDFLTIEALASRMKIARTEYEFILDEEDYCNFTERLEIENLVRKKEYAQAEEKLEKYRKKYLRKNTGKQQEEESGNSLHKQFLFYQWALLEQKKNQMEKEKVRKLFLKAISFTAPNYRQKFEQNEILSNIELSCITEMIFCMESFSEKEKAFEALYEYFKWCYRREGLFPTPYRFAMQHYAKCLYENKKYEKCIQICSEVLEELYTTSKQGQREVIFELRAKAQEKREEGNKEEDKKVKNKEIFLKDYLTACYLIEFYSREEHAADLKKYLKEEYGCQFID